MLQYFMQFQSVVLVTEGYHCAIKGIYLRGAPGLFSLQGRLFSGKHSQNSNLRALSDDQRHGSDRDKKCKESDGSNRLGNYTQNRNSHAFNYIRFIAVCIIFLGSS